MSETPGPDPLTGRWTMNAGLSTFTGPAPKAWGLTVAVTGAGMSVQERLTSADGTLATIDFTAVFDDRPCPVTGSRAFDAIAYRRLDGYRLEGTGTLAGAVTMTDTIEVSPDGQVLTIRYSMHAEALVVVASGVAVFGRTA